jgi:hypothetical protein
LLLEVFDDRLERLPVSMNVGDDSDSHGLNTTFRF